MSPGSGAPKAKAGLDICAAENGFIVFQPEVDRIHHLNHNAVLILELCTGENSSQEIANLVQEAYSLPDPPCQMVEETVANLSRQGFLESI